MQALRGRHLVLLLTAASCAIAACGVTASEEASLDGQPLALAVEAEIADDESVEESEDCPVDDWEQLLRDTLSGVDGASTRSALGGTASVSEFEAEDEIPWGSIICELAADTDDADDAVVGLFAQEAPGDLAAYEEAYAVTFDASEAHRGGQIRQGCDTEDEQYCEVHWEDDHVMVGVYFRGEDAAADLDAAKAGFVDRLEAFLDQPADG